MGHYFSLKSKSIPSKFFPWGSTQSLKNINYIYIYIFMYIPRTESEGLGLYILGLDWEFLASQILQVPSSEDLQSIRQITSIIHNALKV